MRDAVIALAMCSLLLTAAEVAYTLSSPLLGEADAARMTDPAGVGMLPGGDNGTAAYVSEVYGSYYRMRPNIRDPNKGIYKMTLAGWWIDDMTRVGVDFWKSGIFNECDKETNDTAATLERWYRQRPAAVASQFSEIGGMAFQDQGIVMSRGGWGGRLGKRLVATGMGWLSLGDLTGANAVVFFEDRCGPYNNMTSAQFRQRMARSYGVFLARTAFVESVLDEGGPWDGILYMAYYPTHNKTLLLLYNLPEESVRSGTFRVDGIPRNAAVDYPFVIVDTPLDGGSHSLAVETKAKAYALDFSFAPSRLNVEPVATDLRLSGNFSAVLTHLNNTIRVGRAVGVLEGQRREANLDRTLPPYNSTRLDMSFDGPLTADKAYDIDLRIEYSADGQEAWLNRTLTLRGW
jgi:hypothetical protein